MFPNRSLHALCINIAVKNNGCLNMLTRRILMFRIYQQICSTILYEYITHTLFKRQEPTRWQPQTLICQSSKSITQRANSLFPPRLVPFVIDTQYVQQLLLLPFCWTHNMHHHAPRLDERKKQTRRRRRRRRKSGRQRSQRSAWLICGWHCSNIENSILHAHLSLFPPRGYNVGRWKAARRVIILSSLPYNSNRTRIYGARVQGVCVCVCVLEGEGVDQDDDLLGGAFAIDRTK